MTLRVEAADISDSALANEPTDRIEPKEPTDPIEKLDPTALYFTWDVMLTTGKSRADIEDVFLFVMDDMTLEIEPLDDSAPVAEAAPPAPEKAETPPVIAAAEPPSEKGCA